MNKLLVTILLLSACVFTKVGESLKEINRSMGAAGYSNIKITKTNKSPCNLNTGISFDWTAIKNDKSFRGTTCCQYGGVGANHVCQITREVAE